MDWRLTWEQSLIVEQIDERVSVVTSVIATERPSLEHHEGNESSIISC